MQDTGTPPQVGQSDVETGNLPSSSSLYASERRPPTASTDPATIQADAAKYGIKWKPKKRNTFWIPEQAKKNRHIIWLKIMGRIGWGAKAVIYALLGGLACDNAVGDRSKSASPEGAFVLIGTADGGRGALIFFAMCILTYSIWRFWEGFIGQGYDNNFPKWKNFFKFRLSPIVSGSVYVAYDVLVIEVIPRDDDQQLDYLSHKNWPNSWRNSVIGRVGLCFIGIAFIAATLVQLEQFFTKSLHNTIRQSYPFMKKELWRPFRIFVLTTGHIGVLGRGGIFLFAAILFFRTVHTETISGRSAFGNALAQLQGTRGGRAGLFIVGFLTCCYGLFCVLSIYARIFPTPPPSGIKKAHDFDMEDGTPRLPAFSPDGSGFHPLRGPSSKALPKQPGTSPSSPDSAGPTIGTAPAPPSATFQPMTSVPLDPKSSTTSTASSSATDPREFQTKAFSPMSNHLASLELQGNHATRR